MTDTTGADLPPRAFDAQHRASTLGLLALVTMFAFEAVAVSLAMPRVAHALHGETLYPIAVIGLLTTAIVGMVLGGTWSDARGPGVPLTVGCVGFVAGLLVSGLAGSMEVFVLGRLVQGLGSGAALTAMYVAVADAYPSAIRPRVFSLFAGAWVLPSIVGPFVAGALVDLVGWRSVFLVVAAFAPPSLLFVHAAMRPHLSVRRSPIVWGPRPAYAVVVAGGAVALHLAGQGTGPWAVVLLLAGLAVVLVALPRLLPAGTLRVRRGLPAVVAVRGFFGAAFAGVEMFLPLVLQDETRLSPTVSGLVMTVGALGWTAGSAYAGRRASPASIPGIIRTGGIVLVGGAALSMLLVPVDHVAWLATLVGAAGVTLMGAGMGLATPLTSTLALDLAEPGRQGEAGSAVQLSDSLGQSMAAGVVGAVFARWYLLDQGTSYLAGFGMALLMALAGLASVRQVRSEAGTPHA